MSSKIRALTVCGCLLAALLTYSRLYFGVDLDDEAFHVVVSYRYILGARPFVDEINITQIGAGLLAYPFFSIYHAFVGLSGIVLFSRHLYLLFALGISGLVFVSLRVLLRNALLALTISLLALVFIPLDMPSLNYNSLANGFFTAGCLLGLAYTRKRQRNYLLLAGFMHGLAVFSYPTLLGAVAAYAAGFYFLSGRARAALAGYLGATAIPVIAWFVVLLNAGVGNTRETFSLAHVVAKGRDVDIERVINVVHDALANFLLAPLALGALLGTMLLRTRRPRLAIILLGVVPICALPARVIDINPGGSVHYVANFGLLALPLFYACRAEPLAKLLLFGAWVPAFVAASTISWSTFDSGGHQGIGFLPAAMSTVILLALTIQRTWREAGWTSSALSASLAVSFMPVAAIIGIQFFSAMHDGRPLRLSSRVASGPYAGLFTTSENKQFLTALGGDLRRVSDARCSIFFYYDLPAGYLLSASTPDTNTAFFTDREPLKTEYGRRLLEYYDARGSFPDVVVRLTRIPYLRHSDRPRYLASDRLDRVFTGAKYERVSSTTSYAIYARRASECGSG